MIHLLVHIMNCLNLRSIGHFHSLALLRKLFYLLEIRDTQQIKNHCPAAAVRLRWGEEH